MHCDKHTTLRCEECGPLGYFCLECFDNAHRAVNRFHVAENQRRDILQKREQLLLVLWKSSQRRLFLLKLKQKYAGLYFTLASLYMYKLCTEGQKIAKKLSSQISKEGITIRSLCVKQPVALIHAVYQCQKPLIHQFLRPGSKL